MKNRPSLKSGHRKLLVAIMLVMLGGCIAAPSLTQIDLPRYAATAPAYLGVKVSGVKRTLQLITIGDSGDIDIRLLATLTEPWEIIQCSTQAGVLCAVEEQKNSYTLYRWSQPFQSDPITKTGQITDYKEILAAAPQGLFFSTGSANSIWLQPQDQEKPPREIWHAPPNKDCGYGPVVSPTGEYVAALCLRSDWYDYLKGSSPQQPVDEQLYVAKVDGTSSQALISATTYLWGNIAMIYAGVPPWPPAWAWAQNGSEIAFVASFSPPVELQPIDRLLARSLSPYQTFAGIYSITVPDGVFHPWSEVDAGISMAWSPDNKYLTAGGAWIISRAGNPRQISKPSGGADQITWSSDGAYIAGIADHALWILATSDYTWRKVDLPDWVIDVQWVVSP